MTSCLACDARIRAADIEVGETLICDECGAEHEVVRVRPIELALLDEEDHEEGGGGAGGDEDYDEVDDGDEEENGAGPAPGRRAPVIPGEA